ncbi:type IV secretory system conjugative DNA transfer family protein [Kitasatospora sp. NBC_00240]|uniref:hypothetical protein n=1 Tax=Kitasatospora sp. NBC_00240 TaxID=2903567 RepID=UPI00224DB480|nr:hypothetical protein [Kitasatospora sp. NBC_00240]MCX5216144.1 type IV secretory system conjugative DNA transfer family protein [Kitasatospora sp. NBC_00240]
MSVTHRLIVGRAGSGKTRTIEQLIAAEKAACGPAVAVWGIEPTGQRLAGLDRTVDVDQAAQLLTEALTVVAERTARGRDHEPTAAEPHIRIVIDGAEPVLRDTETAGLLHRLAATGRTAAVTTTLTTFGMTAATWPPALRRHYVHGEVTICEHPRTED